MKGETREFNLWTFVVVCAAMICLQISLVKEVYAKEDIILQAEINYQKIQKCGDSYILVLPTKFRLTNKTDKPLLVIRDALSEIGTQMAKSEFDFEKEIFIYNLFTLPSFTQKNLLNLGSPTEDRTEIIPPNGHYEWSSDQWYKFSKTTDILELNPVVQWSSLSLEKLQNMDFLWIKYHVAFFPMNSMGDEGNKLQKNWRKFGQLLLDTYPTQPIKIIIPKEIQELNDSCD